jgi:YVTN family beta-propeller protein
MAASSAAAATSTISVTGTSGSISHSVNFSLTVSPEAPFAIHLSTSSLDLTPVSSATVQISLTANAGTSPQLITSISNPPPYSGANIIPPESLLSASNPLTFSVSVGPIAQALQNFPLVITASDNSNNTSAAVLPLSISVPSAALAPTRTTFLRTDNSPTGAVYDPVRKLVFTTVETLNEVVVLSSTDGHRVAVIPVEQPVGIDESADGSKVIVGAQSPFVTIIDPDLLEVTQQVAAPPAPNPPPGGSDFYFLIQPAALSNGNVLFVAQHGYTTEMHVFLWNPVAGTMTLRDFPEATIFAQTLARSVGRSKVLIWGSSSVGATAVIYDPTTDAFSAPANFNGSSGLALSPDGSQIVAPGTQNNSTGFYDSSFNQLASLPPLGLLYSSGALYSRDGNHAYISGTLGGGDVVLSINTQTYSLEGLVPDFQIGFNSTTPYDVDETGMLFGSNYLGVALLDMSSPGFFAPPTPGTFQLQPTLLSPSAATPTQLNGSQFDLNAAYQVFFGAPPASTSSKQGTAVSVQSSNVISVSAPVQSLQGAANVTLTHPSDGWFEVMPDGATYGPQVLFVEPNAGPAAGGFTTTLLGYGLEAPNVTVTIGGVPAQVSSSGILGVSPFPFPEDRLAVTVPPGTPGFADVTVSTPAGSTTIARGFQYLESAQIYPVTGALDDIIYDQTRQRLYSTNEPLNRVEIFDLASSQYLAPISVGNQPTGLALTPDGSLLGVVNSGDGTVSVIDLVKQQVTATYSVLTANDKSGCGGVAVSTAPVAPHRLLVDVYCNLLAFSGIVHLLNLDTGSLSCTGTVTCAADGTDLSLGSGLFAMSSSPDGNKVLMTDVSGDVGDEAAYVALLNFSLNTLTSSGFGGGDSALSADGDILASGFGFLNSQMFPFEVGVDVTYLQAGALSFNNLAGEKLNPSGSLLFVPQQSQFNGSNGGTDIFDVHCGRLVMRLDLPEQIPASLNAMALDETGTKMFLISNSGITIAHLFQAPLSLAAVIPASGSSGAQVTLRGSGFVKGATVEFGSISAAATFADAQTLDATVPDLPSGPVRVTVTNPDGTAYSFDAAFNAN